MRHMSQKRVKMSSVEVTFFPFSKYRTILQIYSPFNQFCVVSCGLFLWSEQRIFVAGVFCRPRGFGGEKIIHTHN